MTVDPYYVFGLLATRSILPVQKTNSAYNDKLNCFYINRSTFELALTIYTN